MAKARGVVSGPRWPFFSDASGFGFASAQTLDANDERLIFIGQICSDDGLSHDYDTIEFRTGASSLSGDLQVGFADIDTANGPPGRDDGVLDQSATQTNPTANTTYSLTLSGARTITHGGQIAVVFKIANLVSGSVVVQQHTGRVAHRRPTVTSFLGGAYTEISNGIPMVSLKASGDGHYAIIKGGMPVFTATPASVDINTGTAIKRAALAFTVAAPVWGMEGEVMVQAVVAGCDFDIKLYEGTTELATMSVDANTGDGGGARWLSYCFADVALTPGVTYYLAAVPTTTNSLRYFTAAVTTAARWDPLTGANGVGSTGLATFDGSVWSSVDESVLPLFAWWPLAVDNGVGGVPFTRLHNTRM